MPRLHALLRVALLTSMPALALADPPKIGGISPLGARRGAPTDATFTGGALAGNPTLMAPFAFAIETLPGSDAANWKVKLTVAGEVPLGVYPVRIKTDGGLSNPFLFAVGQVAQVAEVEDNSTFEQAQAIVAPVVVEGMSAGNDVDYFKFAGKKGQRVVVDAQCARIGSGVDPTLRLTTAARRFLASADDTLGLLTDARLVATLPEDGEYVVELSDSKYQGSGRAVYRLLIGEIPVAEEVYPLGARRGEPVALELRGGTLGGRTLAAVDIDAKPGVESIRLRVANLFGGLDLDSTQPLEVDDQPGVREPSTGSAIPRITPGTIYNGRIDPAGDVDNVAVAVAPGQALRIQVNAADLGSGLDGTLRVLGPNGATLAEADDTVTPALPDRKSKKKAPGLVSPDPSLDFNVPAGVTEITLSLRDLEGRGGVGFPYRISVEPIVAGFDLALNESELSVPRGGCAAITVGVSRRGYLGPISLVVEGLPPGLTAREGKVGDNQAAGVLTLSAAADASFGVVDLRIIGKAQGPAGPISAAAVKAQVFAQQGPLPTNMVQQQGLPAAPAPTRPITLETADAPIEVVHGYSAETPLKVIRRPGGETGLAVAALPILPAGVGILGTTIAEKAESINVAVTAAADAPLGPATLAIAAKGKLDGKDETLVAPLLSVNVVRPAEVALAAPAIELKAGAALEFKGKLTRRGPFKEPVTLKLNGLPAGVSAEPITLGPDTAEFAFKVVATPEAAPAEAALQLAVAFQVNKKDYPTPAIPVSIKLTK